MEIETSKQVTLKAELSSGMKIVYVQDEVTEFLRLQPEGGNDIILTGYAAKNLLEFLLEVKKEFWTGK